MFVEMQTIITSKVDVTTLEVTHEVVIEANDASVLGRQGVMAVAQGGLKSALAALATDDDEKTED